MQWCNDPFLTLLKSYGYNTVRLPKADIRPLQIMTRQGNSFDRLGELGTILIAGQKSPLPTISENTPAGNLSGQRTSHFSIGIGLSILGTIIGAIGGSTLGLNVKYQQASTAAFEFTDVFEDKIEVAKLDQYLADADVNPSSRYLKELLYADEVFVTSATLKSRKFAMEARTSQGAALEVSIPEIQGVVGGNVKVSGQSDVVSLVTYEGPTPLVFGFQARQLFYDRGGYTAFKPVEPGDVALKALGRLPQDDGTVSLMTEGPFVRLSSD